MAIDGLLGALGPMLGPLLGRAGQAASSFIDRGCLPQANAFMRTLASAFNRTCFAPDTPLLTPEGSKPIREFKVGDRILSAPEWDPDAPPGVQIVEEVFRNSSPLLTVRLGGKSFETTAEHP